MRVIRGLGEYRRPRHPVVTIGNFDGQHLGHMALLRAVVHTARTCEGTPIVLTLDPHPLRVLAPHVELQLLTSREEKLERFQLVGVQEVLFLEFTPGLAALSPEAFVLEILRDGIGVQDLFVGDHFAFGKDRKGRMDDLLRLSHKAGMTVHPVPPIRIGGRVVSSTNIRSLVQQGNLQEATHYLGRPYAIHGRVVPGVQRGTALGWPTANLEIPEGRVVPPDGVYATLTTWKNTLWDSVAYIGMRPTFHGDHRILEVYVLDQRLDIYGEEIHVQFIDRIRGDMCFETQEALAAQIALDVEQAKKKLQATASMARIPEGT